MPTEPATARPLPATALSDLRERLRGGVVEPADAGYAATYRVWNGARQRRPRVIVLPSTTSDVQLAVRFAREHRLTLAVRSTGFSPAGESTCDDGMVIDLRRMRQVRVDAPRERVVVQAGARWGDVDVATQRVGQVVPGAAMAALGVAGSTLSGGAGHLRRVYGLACDNLTAATVVGADGRSVVTGGDERPELLWGLRGGGSNFGVATSLTFRLRPLPEPVLSGTVFFPADHAAPLLAFYREWTRRLREDVSTGLSFFGRAHSAALTELIGLVPDVPLIGVTVVCAGHPAEAQRLIRPLREAGPVLRDVVTARPYALYQSLSDGVHPYGEHAAMDSGYLDELDDDVVAALLERFEQMSPSACELHVRLMGGAVGRVARMSTAVPNRGARFVYSALARWTAPDDEAAQRGWVTGTAQRLGPIQMGGPQVGLRTTAASSVEAYGAERYLRLAALKRRYDPDNVFTLNQNVAPLV